MIIVPLIVVSLFRPFSSSNMDIKGPAIGKLRDQYGLAFNKSGCLKQVDPEDPEKLTNQGFVFDVHQGDRAKNQKRYEEIGEVMNEVIFEYLQSNWLGLHKYPVPKSAEKQSFFFASKDFQEADQLFILIHGSGVVRAGQWSRKLIINNDIYSGSQIPFILGAQSHNYGIVVMNTNHNLLDGESIPGSSSPEEHACSLWDDYIKTSKANRILIVAHSYGGLVVVNLADKFENDFEQRVEKIFLTDSVHSSRGVRKAVMNRLKQIGLNYVTSELEVGKPIAHDSDDIAKVSAGHTIHEWTSYTAMDDIFDHLIKLKERELEQKLDKKTRTDL